MSWRIVASQHWRKQNFLTGFNRCPRNAKTYGAPEISTGPTRMSQEVSKRLANWVITSIYTIYRWNNPLIRSPLIHPLPSNGTSICATLSRNTEKRSKDSINLSSLSCCFAWMQKKPGRAPRRWREDTFLGVISRRGGFYKKNGSLVHWHIPKYWHVWSIYVTWMVDFYGKCGCIYIPYIECQDSNAISRIPHGFS